MAICNSEPSINIFNSFVNFELNEQTSKKIQLFSQIFLKHKTYVAVNFSCSRPIDQIRIILYIKNI